jgi:hypothetical protein
MQGIVNDQVLYAAFMLEDGSFEKPHVFIGNEGAAAEE